ncbi:MAG: tetratricopeptide repeat protein [Betaproteobacteria bacterium]
MSSNPLTFEQKQLANGALAHQNAGRYADAAQAYAALLSQVPHLWPACYNLGLVYQHLGRLPEAAEMYARAVQLNPNLAEGYNNLGNVLKSLKNTDAAIEAYRQALALNAGLSEAAYNLATMLQAGGEHQQAIDSLRQATAVNPAHGNAWDALYRGLLAGGRTDDAVLAFLEWEKSAELSPEMVVAGLALCRPMGDTERETKYVELALAWPFAEFTPDQYAPIVGMIQYFDVTRESILLCYRRFDSAVNEQHVPVVPLLPRRSADTRLRVGYVSGDFRQHVMGRMMLDVIARHDRSRFGVLLISTCAPAQHDATTTQFRSMVDGFADISHLDDFSAAKIIAEADIDVLVDLGGQTNSARPGIYAYRPARSIVTHLGYHGCLGMSSVDYKFTDRIADLPDAAIFQIEKPYALQSCIFPFVRVPPLRQAPELVPDKDLDGKFVFAAFLNVLKLSPRCLRMWRRVLDAVPEAMLLFSPLDAAEKNSIARVTDSAGIDANRIAVLEPVRGDAALRSRYRIANAVMDTSPYAGGDTTLAALDMGVPVVTLAGQRQSERVGASILGHLNLQELVAASEDDFVALAVKLARDTQFMEACRKKIAQEFETALARADDHTRALEAAFIDIASRSPVTASMSLTARQFFTTLHDAMRRQEKASGDTEKRAIAAVFAALRVEQPDYPPLLRAQGQLAQDMRDLALASDCLGTLLKYLPGDVDTRLTLAGFLIDRGNAKDALDILEDASTVGSNVRSLLLQTRAYSQLRQWESALKCSEPAIALEPANTQALFWHGTVLSHVGEVNAALTYLNQALILAPSHTDVASAAYNAGVLLSESGNHVDAEKVFRRAMAADPSPPVQLRLLQTLNMQKRHDDWLVEAQRFVAAFPGLEYATLLESRIARRQGNLKREAELLYPLAEQVAQMKDDVTAFELAAELSGLLPFHDVSPRLLDRLQDRFASASKALHPARADVARANTVPEREKTRLGYLVDLSIPFAQETIASLVRLHDRDLFTTAVFTVSPPHVKMMPDAGIEATDWVSLAGLDEDRCAVAIGAHKIDVLIDASAFGDFSRPGLLSLRPALLQIAMPAMARPAAIGEHDFVLTDRHLQLVSDKAESLRRNLFVEGCALPISAPAQGDSDAQSNLSTRESLGIKAGATVFGVLATAEQLSSRCVALWQSLLARAPNAVLLLAPPDTGDVAIMRNILRTAGIDAARIISHPYSNGAATRAPGLVDIILDTVPGSDYSSVRASLLESIPLVTAAGKTIAERVALSVLTSLGEKSTIAESGREYVDIAVDLATHADKRNALASRLNSLWSAASQPGMPFAMDAYVKRIEAAISHAANLNSMQQ